MKPYLFFVLASFALVSFTHAQSILLGGFDGNQTESTSGSIRNLNDPVQDAGAVGNFGMSLSTDLTGKTGFTGFDWASGFQSSSATWGQSTFTTAADTTNNNAVYATDTPTFTHTINMVLTNTGTGDITLDKFHIRVKRDGANSPTGIRFAYASGDLSDTPGGNTLLDVSSAGTVGFDLAFSSVVSDLTLAAGENATFTWVTEGGTGQRLRVDNIAVSGEVVISGPDTDPPTPDPMTWTVGGEPAAASDSSITMTATTATDPSGVQYYFTCTSGGGNDSVWQSSPSYTDTGLSSGTTYTYTVKARDAVGLYETAASAAESATTSTPDTSKPSPDPMTFAVDPVALSYDTITMTATTATDDSEVEYQFTRWFDGSIQFTSVWQDGTEYTDTDLDPETTYTYTVTARDKSTAQNTTAPSTAKSATTPPVPVGPVLLGGFDGSNAVNAPIQHSSAVGKISMELDTSLEPSGLNPGNFMQSSSILWGTTDLDPDAENTGTHNAVLFKNGPYDLFITVTNTSADKDVTLENLHWRSKRDTSDADDYATITYVSGSLTDSLGTNTEYYLEGLGAIGHDFPLSDLLTDAVLAPGETVTFSWFIEAGASVRWDNIALSGTFSDSDYISWSSGQSWTVGDPGTSGNDDYDLDGLSNDGERVFGLDPMDAQSRNPIATPLDATAGSFSYTRRTQSLTGLNYAVFYSTNLEDWFRDFNATHTPGTPANNVEMVDVTINPVLLDEPKLFIRLGAEPPLTLPAPELINVAGNNSTVTLNFNQELYPLYATDTGNFTVELDGGAAVTVTDASLSANRKTVTLTLDSNLSLASAYNVSFSNLTGLTGVATTGSSTGQFETWDDDPAGIKVFILAGQSNMVGYGHAENGNGGVAGAVGSLRYLANNNASYPEYDYTSLLDDSNNPTTSAWRTRSNIKVWGQNGTSGILGGGILKGDLGPFYGATNATAPDTWFGPEYAFGQVIGDFYASDDVLIIKAAWGGHSLGGDFRPPSAVADRGGEIGASYLEMFKNVREVLDNLDTEFPGWAVGKGYQIVGFAWHQGVSDGGEPFATEHKENLPDFIGDVRAELGKPNLPFAIATTGMLAAGAPMESFPYTGYSKVEQAQLWAAGVAQPANTLTDDTRGYWEEAADSPRDQGFHWNQNARSYFRVGLGLGDKMVDLLTP